MGNNVVYYFGYNTNYGNPNRFKEFPSCNSKMEYIIDSLLAIGFNVKLFSLGESKGTFKVKKVEVKEGLSITYFSTVSNKFRMLSKIYLIVQLIYFILFKIEKDAKVIVYHSVYLAYVFKYISLVKQIEIIYEVEEIYNAAWKNSASKISKEIRSLTSFNKYILINDLIKDKIGLDQPSIVCYGNYKSHNVRESTRIATDKIRILYAGLIGDSGSDVFLAIETMKFLPSKYELRIVGYGNPIDLEFFKDTIENLDNVYYDGFKSGKDYLDYLQTFNIGLNTRVLDDTLSDFTFPSKVLIYLGNGLRTISTDISCIRLSKVGKSVNFIRDLSPKGIANTIISTNDSLFTGREVLLELDSTFKRDLKKLIE